MKKRVGALLLLAVLICTLALPASADMGPKPSVTLQFSGLEGQRYAVTLLSDAEQCGPWSADPDYHDWMGEYDLWEAFCAYPAPEGWYFQGEYEECTETGRFAWTYYPPQRFYILLYFPDNGEYRISPGVYERYAFDSTFAVRVSGEEWDVRTNYDYRWELVSLLCRIFATIAVEAAVAWLFGLRTRRYMRIILCTNAVTQVLLNTALNFFHYSGGPMLFCLVYGWLELAVFLVEGVVYARRFPAAAPQGKRVHPWLYALAANLASCAAGAAAAWFVPGIF